MKWNVGRVKKVNKVNDLFYIITLLKVNIIYTVYIERATVRLRRVHFECTMLRISMHEVYCIIKSETAWRHEKTNNRRENNDRKKMTFMHIHFAVRMTLWNINDNKACSLLMSRSRADLGSDQTTNPQMSGRPALPPKTLPLLSSEGTQGDLCWIN